MKILDKWALNRVKNFIEEEPPTLSLADINDFFNKTKYKEVGDDLSEITYFTCLKVLSESVGKLSVHLKDREGNKIYDHNAIRRLKIRPNEFMTPSTFRTVMELCRNHYGNAYAYMEHNKKGELVGLYPLHPNNMKIWIDDEHIFKKGRMFFEYTNPKTQETRRFSSDEIIHLKGGISENGLAGQSIAEILGKNLQGAKESQRFLNELYDKGLTANAVIKYTGQLDRAKKKTLTEELKNFSEEERFIPLPLGMDIQTLDLKLTDSQFFELKKFSSLQIAAAFGVKPNHLNNYDKSSYANSEMQNLTFYIDTLLYILTQWEEELNYKLLTKKEQEEGYGFEFNIATILRGDIKTQAEALTMYTSGSIYKVNEARRKAGLPPIDEGDVIMVNGSYTKLDDIGMAYQKKGGD